MKYQKMGFKSQNGFSLMELGIVLAIIGVLAMAAVAGYGMFNTAKNESAAKKINTVMSALQNKWKFDPNTAGVSNVSVNNAGVLDNMQWPITVAGATTTIMNEYGGAVTFAPGKITTANDAFSLTFANLSGNQCGDIARNVTMNAYKISVGATVVQASPAARATGIAIDNACAPAVNTLTLLYAKNPG